MGADAQALGIDVGGTNLRAARVDAAGTILASAHARSSRDPETALRQIVDLAREVAAPALTGIGIGIPGRVDAAAGRVLSGGILDLRDVSLVERVGAVLGVPVRLESDCTMALLAEVAFGAARGCRDVVMLTIGTGIGGAAMVDGNVLRGRASGGQFGHLTVDMHGLPCACGRRGCVETTSSGTALGRLVAEAGLTSDTRIEALLRDGADPAARGVLLAWAAPLRAAVDSLVAAFDPEVVVIGGGLGGAAVQALALTPALSPWYRSAVRAAALGDDAGVIGAAWCVLQAEANLRRGGTLETR